MPILERKARNTRNGWLVLLVAGLIVAAPTAQEGGETARTRNLDQLLDLYVRNGDVYYRAIKSERAKLDGFVSQLANASATSPNFTLCVIYTVGSIIPRRIASITLSKSSRVAFRLLISVPSRLWNSG